MVWLEFYLAGAAVGVLVAVRLIIKAIEEYYSSADWAREEIRLKMVWSIVSFAAAAFLLPVVGVIVAGLLYLVLR